MKITTLKKVASSGKQSGAEGLTRPIESMGHLERFRSEIRIERDITGLHESGQKPLDQYYTLKKSHNFNQLDENRGGSRGSTIEKSGSTEEKDLSVFRLKFSVYRGIVEHQAKNFIPSTRNGKSCWRRDRGDDMGRYLSGLLHLPAPATYIHN